MRSREEGRTGCDLCGNGSIALHVKMFDILPEQALQKGLPQRVCGSSSCNAHAQCSEITDDEAANEQVHEPKDQGANSALELLLVALSRGIVDDRPGR